MVGSRGAILHWDGSGWRRHASGTDGPVHGVWGTGAEDVWAVGGDGIRGEVLHFDGAEWTRAWTGRFSLEQVWGAGPGDVWAVGAGAAGGGAPGGTILHWDGGEWNPAFGASDQGVSTRLNAVWGSGPGDVYVAGEVGLFLHWDGRGWARQDRWALWESVTGTAADDVYATGTEGSFHFDGTEWSPFPVPSTARLNRIRSIDGDLYAVGPEGALLRRR